MDSTCRPDVVKLPLPPGVKAGTMVGKGGHNVRWLHFQSGGAHITVSDAGITIRAKESHVRERALILVRRQLQAAEKLGACYDDSSTLPLRLDYVLLPSAFGTDPRVSFRLRKDEVAGAVVSKDNLYELVPEPRGCYGDSDDSGGPPLSSPSSSSSSSSSSPPSPPPSPRANDSPPHRCSCNGDGSAGSKTTSPRDQDGERDQDPHPPGCWGSKERESSGGASDDGAADRATRFHAATAAAASWSGVGGGAGCSGRCGGVGSGLLASAGRALAAAAHKAACCEPGFDVIKIRFKLGKSLFRNLGPRAGRTELSVADLEGAGGGRGAYQSVFSNYIPASAVPRVTAWLTEALGFSLVDTKTTASLHVINQELNVHYSIALAMEKGDDSTAVLRKLKAGGAKGHCVTLMAAPHQLDCRLKLIPQFREHPGLACDADAHATARRVAAAVRAEGFEGFTRSKRGLPRNRHLEYARWKTKFVYEGSFPGPGQVGCGGQRLRVSVTEVQDDKGTHFEISGCLPDVDAALRHTLRPPQQRQHRPAAPALEDSSSAWVPEWRRGRSTGSSGGASAPGPVSTPACVIPEWRRGRGGSAGGALAGADAPAACYAPEWRRRGGGSAGGADPSADRRLYDNAGNPSPPPSPTTPPMAPRVPAASSRRPEVTVDAQWAETVLARLSRFVSQLNAYLEQTVAAPWQAEQRRQQQPSADGDGDGRGLRGGGVRLLLLM